jgi:hypothetical protein
VHNYVIHQDLLGDSLVQKKSLRWTDEAKREHIKENTNIDVPREYKSEYEKLILKHFKSVSIGKNNLGRVKVFFLQNLHERQQTSIQKAIQNP